MSYSESDTRAKLIDPKLKGDGWIEDYIVREWYFTDGRILVGGKRGERCFADYLLIFQWINLAIIEAKSNDKEPTEWLEQVKDYGRKLKLRYVYSTNGEKIYEFDLVTGRWSFIEKYPTPQELYERYVDPQAVVKQKILAEPYARNSNKKPRYYQDIAIRSGLSAIASNAERVLLTLATGTGKTFIAFQICRKLFQSRWSRDGIGQRRPRILFLADRNILVDQAMNDFNTLEKDCIKITGKEIRKRWWKAPTNANIFFAIYQAVLWGWESGETTEMEWVSTNEIEGYFRQYDPDFFDLIIIDECHRWGANESGSYRHILDHFKSAVHLGLTATPKRQDNVDTYKYFGDPVYEYSLKEGINDGFLTPYKVKRVRTNLTEVVITSDITIVKGEAEKDLYTQEEFNKRIIIQERNELVAEEILKLMQHPLNKTIVFCVDQDHALRMRDAINQHKTINDPDYCVRVTSNEGDIGRTFLERFQDNDKTIPAILTSSQMLTTGVDARNVRNIVLLRNIGSMVEFKQIIGRGTRLFDGKDFFTIIDFTGATNKFYDPEWDGDGWIPDPTDEPDADDGKAPKKEKSKSDDTKESTEKLEIKLDNRVLRVTNIETRYIDESWKPLSATEFISKLVGQLPSLYDSEDQLRKLRSNPETRENLLDHLARIGIDQEQLADLQVMFDAEESDIFDVLMHISFNAELRKRYERVDYVEGKAHIVDHYEKLEAKEFLQFLLDQYEKYGIQELSKVKIITLVDMYRPGHYNLVDMARVFGGSEKLKEAYYELQKELYELR